MKPTEFSVLGPLMGGFGSQAFLGCLHAENSTVTPAVMVFLADEIVMDMDLFRRVWVETVLGTQIDHVNVIGVMGLARLDEGYARVVEYADAESLRSVFRRALTLKDPVTPALACALIADAAMGVHYAHELGAMESSEPMIHGGLRPETLQVSFKGMGKVTGYGATTIAEVARRQRNDAGRDAYTAPEQAYGGRAAATAQTDIYALGCVLYEALTRKAPFPADNDLAEAMIRDELARPQHGGLTEAMRNVVLRATRKKSSERYATALEMRQDILETCGPASEQDVALYMDRLFPTDTVPRATRNQMLAAARATPPPPTGRLLSEIPPELVRAHSIRPTHLTDTEVEAAQGRSARAPGLARSPVPTFAEAGARGDLHDDPTFIPDLADEGPSSSAGFEDAMTSPSALEQAASHGGFDDVSPSPIAFEGQVGPPAHPEHRRMVSGGPHAAPSMRVEDAHGDAEITDRLRRRAAPARGAATGSVLPPKTSRQAHVTQPPDGAYPSLAPPAVVYRTSPAVLFSLGVFATLAAVGLIAFVSRSDTRPHDAVVQPPPPHPPSLQPPSLQPPSLQPPSPQPASLVESPPPPLPIAPGTGFPPARTAPPSVPRSRTQRTPAGPGKLVVNATPSSMVITVNGSTIGTGTGTWEGMAGSVKVVARDKDLGARVSQTVKVRAGETVTVELEAQKGTLTFDQLADGLDVFVDGKRLGRTPLPAVDLYSGPHRIDVKNGSATVTLNGVVVAGRELFITADFQ